MHHSFKNSFMFVVVILALLLSAVRVMPVLADDETPPPPATEAPIVVLEPAETEEPVVTAVPPATAAPVLTAEPPGTPEPGLTQELSPTELPLVLEEPPTTEATASVADALEQLPADTVAVLLDENGNPEPLATQEAAEIVQSGDPLWCPAGATPIAGVDGCTASYTGLYDLLSYLDLNEPTQAGVIWIEGDYDSSVNDPGFVYNFILTGGTGGAFFTMSQYDLTIQGGWSGGNNTLVDHNNPSVFNGDTLEIYEWIGNLTINDIQIVNANDSGLAIISYGDVDLDHVTANGNYQNGADVEASGNIRIAHSTFNNNIAGFGSMNSFPATWPAGLEAHSANGSVTLNGVTANGNIFGANLSASGAINVTDSHFDQNGVAFTVFRIYTYPLGVGLVASSTNGSVTLDGVTASGNFRDGAELWAEQGNIFITGSAFNHNGYPYLAGFKNEERGSSLQTAGNVFVGCSEFRGNGNYGIDASQVSGSLTLANVIFAGNGTGDYVYNGDVITSNNCHPASGNPGSGKSQETVLYYLVERTPDQLPAALADGNTFVSALQAILTPAGEKATDLTITLSFPIPQGMQTDKLAVLFWNGTEWTPVPGGNVVGDYFVITVSGPGYYVLVSR